MILSLQGVQSPGVKRHPVEVLGASSHEALSRLAGMIGKGSLGSIANDISDFVDNQARAAVNQSASPAPVLSLSPKY